MRINARLLSFLAISSFCGFVAPAAAQSPDSLMQGIREAYRQLSYTVAEERAMAALSTYDRFNNSQLVEIHVTLGLINYAQNELDNARRQFQNALALQPDLVLDPVLVSPVIREFFDQIKSEMPGPVQPQDLPPPSIRYVQLVDVQTGAALRSLVLPGWGQLYKEQQTKGWVLIGLWGVTASGAVVSGIIQHDAHNDLEEGASGQLPDLQDRYDRWRYIHRGFFYSAAAVWLYSYLDALLDRPSIPQMELTPHSRLYVHPSVGAFSVTYRLDL
jgi:hypothetical protein